MDQGDEYDQYADPSPSQFDDASASPPSNKHTQFLDLTNGEGGERNPHPPQHDPYEDADEEMSDGGGGGGGGDGGGRRVTHAAPPDNPSTGDGSSSKRERNFDPNTPGRVVESGQEHTGRWTKEEHEAFLSALRMYGKEWKKVAAKVKTRTVVQTRTHAQKYFQKLAKAVEGGKSDVTDVEMGVAAEARRLTSTSQKKKGGGRGPASSGTTAVTKAAAAVVRQQSLTNAAHLITNLATTTGESVANVNRLPSAGPNSSSLAGYAKQSQLPGGGSAAASLLKSGMYHQSTARHGFSTAAAAAAAQAAAQQQEAAAAAAAYPSSAYSATTAAVSSSPAIAVGGPAKVSNLISTAAGSASSSGVGPVFSSPMKIVAPEHDAAAKRGKFPEPSPAACGKRKLAEIAAARMLAGVLSSGGSSSEKGGGKALMLSPNAAAMDDGTATPPPEDTEVSIRTKELPAPQPPTDGVAPNVESSSMGFKKPGLSLQIVNPESLGVSYEQQQKRRREGQGSPQTPWEGELDALISEEKKKDTSTNKESDDIPRAPEIDGFGSASSPHAVCGPGSAYGRNPLHKSVCDMDLSTLQSEMSFGRPPEYFQRPDEAGYCPIHSACSLCMKGDNSSIATDIVRMLATAGADLAVCDSEGNTPLHWAARAGDDGTSRYLLLRNCPKDAKNKRGETPLHWALRAGRGGMSVASVLLENGAYPSIWSIDFKRPIDVAADGFHDEEGSIMELRKLISQRKRLSKEQRKALKDAAEERKEARANFLKISAQSRTLVLHHPECLDHIPKAASDWENPDRIVSILDRLNGTEAKPSVPKVYEHEIAVSQEFDRAKLDLLSRVHSTEYLKFVNELSKDLERQHKELNGSNEKVEDSGAFNKPPVVPFTPMVQRTMIKVAESSVKLGQHSDTSFSAGSLRAARRAAGAVQHAVDWKGKRETKSFQYKFYPGTGDEDDVALNIINVPITPLWKEKEAAATPPVSTHNTRNRARKNTQNGTDGESSEAGTPKVSDAENEPMKGAPSSGTSSPVNQGLSLSTGRMAYRQAIQNRLLPALRAFNPDLILISAGFDACKGDVGNAKHEFGGKEKMGIDLEPEDYAWTTRKVLEIADICCHGRVVSVLEGGYGKTPPSSSSSDPSPQPLDKSSFSECALRHVHAMIDPYDSEARFTGKHDN